MLLILVAFLMPSTWAQNLTSNSQIIAVAHGCRYKLHPPYFEEEKMNELIGCYQTALMSLPRREATPLQLASLTCSQFKSDKLRNLKCLKDFQKSIQDPDLQSLLESCLEKENELALCFDEKKQNCELQESNILQCLKQNKKNFKIWNQKPIQLSEADLSYIKSVNLACGSAKDISSTNTGDAQIKGQVNCYQMGLLGLEKNLPSKEKLVVEFCSQFSWEVEKVNCVKRIVADDLEKAEKASERAYGTKAIRNEKIIIETPLSRLVDKCLNSKSESKSRFKLKQANEKFYENGYECITDELKSKEKAPSSFDSRAFQ